MHPELVAGAWVGFNDARITLSSDYWGQGAHSALPIVGDFFGNALRTRIIDPRTRFEAPDETGLLQRLFGGIKDRFMKLFAAQPKSAAKPPRRAAPAPAAEITPLPHSEADPLQEEIDQILEESRREESAGDGSGSGGAN
jgi:penicillin-binding protein 1A